MSNKTIGNILIISAYVMLSVTIIERTFRLEEARDQNRELMVTLDKCISQMESGKVDDE